MAEDDRRNDLRVGGWVPPYSTDGSDPVVPRQWHGRPALPRAPEQLALGAGRAAAPPPRRGVILAAVLALGCAATAVIAFGGDPDDGPQPVAGTTAVPLPAVPYEPPATISLRPKPSRSSASKVVIPTSPAAARATSRSPSPARTTTSPPTARPPAPPPTLAVGAVAGLESADRPGRRVRHRHFAGRLDPVSSASSETDRADSGFTVRAGRADQRCFSLESVNFPGYYLRHRNFEIHLDRSDRTKLFDEDSTFCTVTIRRGTALALRSLNFPARFVVTNDDRLVLRETGAEGATGFVPRSAL